MRGFIDIFGCAGYINSRPTQVLSRRAIASGGKIWLIFRDMSRLSQALRGALDGRSLWLWPRTARRSRSISRRAPRRARPSSRKSAPLADERSQFARTSPSSLRSPIWRRASQGELRPVDILVNNAGVAVTGVREEDFDRGIAVNLKSAFLCTEAVLPGMIAPHWGRIVNISSGAARGRACLASSTTRQRPGSRA